jgi:hypothetical protein
MSTYEQEQLWRSAKAFAGDKLFDEILERLTQKYIQTWATSDPRDVDVRDDAYQMVRAVASLRTELTALAAEPDVVKFNSRLKRS